MRLAAAAAALAAAVIALAAPSAHAGQIGFGCEYSHSFKDDPIVAPGLQSVPPNQPTPAGQKPIHIHSFSGNATTNSLTTAESLLDSHASTTCSPRDFSGARVDNSAYWIPSMLVVRSDGTLDEVPGITGKPIYYRGDRHTVPFPPGMRFITGDSKATSPQSGSLLHWSCLNGTLVLNSSVPWCRKTTNYQPQVRLTINFADCWDGIVPAGPSYDYTPHMSFKGDYGTPNDCKRADVPSPPDPVRVPQLLVFAQYATPGGDDASTYLAAGVPPPPGSVMLSSACNTCYEGRHVSSIQPSEITGYGTVNPHAGWYSAHADFFMGWKPDPNGGESTLEYLVRVCINADCTTDSTVQCSPTTVAAALSTACTVTVKARNGITPTGTVSWKSNGPGAFSGGAGCTLAETTTGSAACSLDYTPSATPSKPTRTDTITTTYSGDTLHRQNNPGTTSVTVLSAP